MTRPRVFLSYSHRDERDLRKLLSYWATSNREGLVDVWMDKDLRGGDRWQDEVEAALSAATIAVLLISQNFMVSEFICQEELPRILARQIEGRLAVSQHIKLSEFQGFGTPNRH